LPKGSALEAEQSGSNAGDRLAAEHGNIPFIEALSGTSISEAIDEPQAVPATGTGVVPEPKQVAGRIEDKHSRDRSLYQELLGGLYDAVVIVDPKV